MNFFTLSIFLAIVATSSCFSFYNVVLEEWEAFKAFHGKKYENDIEENFRLKIFAENKHHIAQHNKLHSMGKKSYSLKMNEFGDLLHQEFVSIFNGLKGLNHSALREFREQKAITFLEPDDDIVLPQSIDWREKGAVTPVKDQGMCGSCWAFSATGALEGQHYRKTRKLVSLSEQNLIDCSRKYGNNGCEGGLMDFAFEYVKENHGIDTEDSYPYTGEDDPVCLFKKDDVGADEKGYYDVRNGSESALKKAVATVGPVSVAIDASHNSFQFYHEGIYYEPECSPEVLDHGVLTVGYGSNEQGDYWIVKNSWGTTWGKDGYVLMARNKDNNCGIASAASFPIV